MLRSLLLLSCLGALSAWADADVPGSKDHPLLTRIKGSVISDYSQKDFDSVDVSAYLSGADAKWEGKTTRLRYAMPEGSQRLTLVQIERNYEAALKKAGAKVLSSSDHAVLARLDKGGATTFVMAAGFNDGALYELTVVEVAAMAQEVVADAAALKAGLAAEGKVAVYGIYFDSGKAAVKPESGKALEQMVKLLEQDKTLQLFVVGHTDGVGSAPSNQKLSADRAAAVVKELTSRGVAAARLTPIGVGPYAPVASNRSEEGKAKNRRVELVDRLQ